MRYRLEPARCVVRLSETKILVTSSEELARKAQEHYARYGGFGSNARMLYGLLLEYDKGRRFLKYIEVGRVYSIDELRGIASGLSGADKLSFAWLLRDLPEHVRIYDSGYVKSRDRIPRVIHVDALPGKMLRKCIDVGGSGGTVLICEFSRSYWIVIEKLSVFDCWREALVIPRDVDLDAVARYLEPEDARRIIRFPLPDAEHEAVEKAKELKALLALLFPGADA